MHFLTSMILPLLTVDKKDTVSPMHCTDIVPYVSPHPPLPRTSYAWESYIFSMLNKDFFVVNNMILVFCMRDCGEGVEIPCIFNPHKRIVDKH